MREGSLSLIKDLSALNGASKGFVYWHPLRRRNIAGC